MWANANCVFFRRCLLAVIVAAVLPCRAAEAEGLAELTEAAEAGSAVDQAKLGYLYYVGKGVAQDPAKAAHWFGAAAKQGHADACYNLGAMYYTGRSLAQDRGEAIKWFRCAAGLSHPQGSYFLGISLIAESDDAAATAEGLGWLQQAAQLDHIPAQVKLADLARTGTAMPVDYEVAAYWYDQAARNGDATAQYNLGRMYYAGQGVTANTDFAVYWLQQASARGLQQATQSLQDIRANGNQVAAATPAPQDQAMLHAEDGAAPSSAATDNAAAPPDGDKAAASPPPATQAGHLPERVISPPLANVAEAPDSVPNEADAAGAGVTGNTETAATAPASEAQSAPPPKPGRIVSPPLATAAGPSQETALAMKDPNPGGWRSLSVEGNGEPEMTLPYGQPIATIEEQALLGEPQAQLLLAAYHHTGNKVIQSWELAVVWLRKAAQSGMPLAQRLLGHYYHAGIGTELDRDESIFWYQIATTGGSKHAAALLSRHARLNPDLVHENLYLHIHALAHDKTELLAVRPPVGNHVHSPSTESMASADLLRARYDFETGLSYNLEHNANHNLGVAFSWFLRAAQLGYAPAQHRVGIAMAHGHGTDADPKRARTWLRRAANQGHLLSQRSLAALAEQQQDLVTAYAWRSIAALGNEREDINGLEQLARRMSPNQIDAARITAEGMLPSSGTARSENQPKHDGTSNPDSEQGQQ